MTLTVLSDNRSSDSVCYPAEHGLSILLEAERHTILLDTGASDLLVQNAQRLGKDLSLADYVFLSHGHADHAGGLSAFLSVNSKASILVSPDALSRRFFSKRNRLHSITAQWPLNEMEGRTKWVTGTMELEEDIHIIARIPQLSPMPKGNANLYVETADGNLVRDDFRHEIALYDQGLLFTGCAHSGLLNILQACPWPLHTVVGGFHLLDSQPHSSCEEPAELLQLAQHLQKDYPSTTFYTSHCTGDQAFQTLKGVLGQRLQSFCCGMRFLV